jgi:phage N-6-adenine-methyltransferase
MSIHFSSKSNEWETPQWLFDELNKEFGPLELDVCATKENSKCPDYFDINENGLLHNWGGTKCWMNPPYGREIGKWVKKAYKESQNDCLICCLLPARTDTKWFHEYCLKGKIKFLKGRLKFSDSENSAPFPSMIVVFNGSTN